MGQTILVTGGLGFIGTNIIRKLLSNSDYAFIILDKNVNQKNLQNFPQNENVQKRLTIIQGDLTKRKDVSNVIGRAQIVIHLAADAFASGSLDHPSKTLETNIMSTAIILEEIAKRPDTKMILFSSSEVYGNKEKNVQMDEMHPFQPVTPYAVSKLTSDRLAYSFYLTKKIPVVIVRPFNVYGPYQTTNKMIPRFITQLLLDQTIRLNHAGKPVRDWIYIDDIANAVDIILKTPIEKIKGEAFNLGTGTPTAIKEVAYFIAKTLGKNANLIQLAESSQPETMGNIGISNKAAKYLGWQPEVSLDQGLTETILWYKNHTEWWNSS